jgi:class 3 adenylate cyclase
VASFERWRRCVGEPAVIDLGELRARAAPATGSPPASHTCALDGPAPAPAAAGPAAVGPSAAVPSATRPAAAVAAPPAPVVAARPQRTLKTLLFADFAGYSRLHDAFAPLFQGRFWSVAADQIAASPAPPLLANTWGDALYVVFESPNDGALFALGLLARMRAVDWTAAGMPAGSQIRIALHSGPVFCGFDPIMARDNYFGASVTRTARIEPVTPPGTVYASEAFAATLAATGQHGYALEYVGQLPLAKGFGESRIYRLDRH